MSLELTAPQLLTTVHRFDDFSCGESVLDEWLKHRAMANQVSGASRTLVVADRDNRLCLRLLRDGDRCGFEPDGYWGARRNMPDPIPLMVLARLAVDRRAQGIKLGGALLGDAVNRSVTVSQNTGVRALLVHAPHEHAKSFYEHCGFQSSPVDPMRLMLRLSSGRP